MTNTTTAPAARRTVREVILSTATAAGWALVSEAPHPLHRNGSTIARIERDGEAITLEFTGKGGLSAAGHASEGGGFRSDRPAVYASTPGKRATVLAWFA